jgi:hypothetical protein
MHSATILANSIFLFNYRENRKAMKKSIGHNMCTSLLLTTFIWNMFRSDKNLAS